jgi:hypothetical protein
LDPCDILIQPRKTAPAIQVQIILTMRRRKASRRGQYHHEDEARAIACDTISRMHGRLQLHRFRQYRQIFPPADRKILTDARSRAQHCTQRTEHRVVLLTGRERVLHRSTASLRPMRRT